MSSGQPILAIDQGTSGTKAVVVDADGVELAVVEEPVRPVYRPGGEVEVDPAALLASVLTAGHRALAAAGQPVAAVALANQGETVLAWDPDTGRALSPGIVWQDRRAETLVAELVAGPGAGGWVEQRTGLVLDPYFTAPKLAWLRRNLGAAGVVTTTDSWLIHQLSGEFVTDAATVSRSLLTDLDSVTWDEDLLALFGLGSERLPLIVACDEIIGTTTAFGAPIPVGGLIVDQQAALLAESCLTPGTAKCTFGTGAFLLANTGRTAVRSSAGLTSSVAWRARGETAYCLDGQVYTAGSAIRWLTDLGLIAGPEEIDARAAGSAGGALCVPALAGLAAPWWRSDATAVFSGMTLSTGPGELILAVLQGIAAQVAELADLVSTDLDGPLQTLRVDGGLTRCRTLIQATADLLQIPVEVYPSAHATALGAAALGRLAITPGLTLASAVPPRPATESYRPQWSADQAGEFRERWRAAVPATLAAPP
jgi:glycerol kinase